MITGTYQHELQRTNFRVGQLDQIFLDQKILNQQIIHWLYIFLVRIPVGYDGLQFRIYLQFRLESLGLDFFGLEKFAPAGPSPNFYMNVELSFLKLNLPMYPYPLFLPESSHKSCDTDLTFPKREK